MFSVRNWVERAARFFHLESWFRLLMLCVLVGIVAGAGAIAFEAGLNLLHHYLLDTFLFVCGGNERWYYLLVLAGVAGGIGAIFKAPLGGALFAAEVLYRDPDFEHDAVIPGVISSVTAYSVFTAVYGHARILDVSASPTPLTFPSPDGNAL